MVEDTGETVGRRWKIYTSYLVTLINQKMIYSLPYITISLMLILHICQAVPCSPSYSKCQCYGSIGRINCSRLGNITHLPLLNHTGEQEGLTQANQLIITGWLLKNGSATTIWSKLPAHAFKEFRVSFLCVPFGLFKQSLI